MLLSKNLLKSVYPLKFVLPLELALSIPTYAFLYYFLGLALSTPTYAFFYYFLVLYLFSF